MSRWPISNNGMPIEQVYSVKAADNGNCKGSSSIGGKAKLSEGSVGWIGFRRADLGCWLALACSRAL